MTLPVLRICRACPLRARPSGGHAACTVDAIDWRHHVRAGYCPHPSAPRFGKGAKPAGWNHPAVPVPKWRLRFPGPGDALAGAIKVVTFWRVKMCESCRGRRRTMNQWGWWEMVRHPVRTAQLFYSNE